MADKVTKDGVAIAMADWYWGAPNKSLGDALRAVLAPDGYEIRTAAVRRGVPSLTTIQGLSAAVLGIEGMLRGEVSVRSLQEYGRDLLDHGDITVSKTAPREG